MYMYTVVNGSTVIVCKLNNVRYCTCTCTQGCGNSEPTTTRYFDLYSPFLLVLLPIRFSFKFYYTCMYSCMTAVSTCIHVCTSAEMNTEIFRYSFTILIFECIFGIRLFINVSTCAETKQWWQRGFLLCVTGFLGL